MVGIEDISKRLNSDPSENNWKSFSAALKKSKIVYYRVFFGKGKLSKTQDLRNSCVELYDKKKEIVAKVPIFMNKGKEIGGATIYLKGLQILNK